MQAASFEFTALHPIHSRVRIAGSGEYGTVMSWAIVMGPLYVVVLDTGRKVVAPGSLLERAIARRGWHNEAIVLEGCR